MAGSLKTRLSDLRLRVQDTERDIAFVESLGSVDYLEIAVGIRSFWADKGETSIVRTGKGGLEAIMGEAIAEFKKVNERSDVQGSYHVVVVLPSGNMVAVDEKYYEKFKDRR